MAIEISETEAEHWNGVRESRGWTWAQLADDLERNNQHDPATHGIVEYARGRVEADKSPRAAKRGTERAVTKAPEKRG